METDGGDEEIGPKRTDRAALQILATWVLNHDGVDPITGVAVDREFVLVDVPTMSTHKLA
jgi:hypothetical protein